MKKIWLAYTMIIAMGMSGCVDSEKDLYQEDPGKQTNTSKFATEQSVNVEINYSKAGAKVPFFIYDQNPLVSNNESASATLKNIQPLDGCWTDENGKFTDKMTLPAYISDVYILSKAFYAQMLMKGKIVNGVLQVSDTDEPTATRARYTSPTVYDSKRFVKLGWSTNLGDFDTRTGKIKYAYEGKEPELTLTAEERKDLKNTVYSVLNTLNSCPKEYRTTADLQVEKDETKIVLTALGGWTCWNSSLGYYYYRMDGGTPTNIKDAKVFAVFPNTQTAWNNGSSYQSSPEGVKEGTAVQLYFYGENGTETEGKNFPKGYRIGFVLACNAWNTYFTGYSSHNQTVGYFSSSTEGLSSKGANNIDVHTAMFKDKKTGNIAIAFEDFKDDENFTDVIFSLKANPEIINVPEVTPDLNTTIEKKGIYAFEDEWPQAKDYDMNDVVVQYTYQKTFNVYNEILQEVFIFKTHSNEAVYPSGLAFTLKNTTNGGTITEFIKIKDSDEFVPTQFEHETGNVIKLIDEVKTKMEAKFKVVIDYDKAIKKTKETIVDAFIFRKTTKDSRLEIHCPMQAPTSKVDTSFFGLFDDRSEPEKGIYYVTDKNKIYPFAFYLSNATVADIAPLLDVANEKRPINELYPKFIDWAKNGTNPNWYKK